MNKRDLLIELKKAQWIASHYKGGYSDHFLDVSDFVIALRKAIVMLEAGDDSCIKDLWLWFSPTADWDDFVGKEGLELGDSIYKELDRIVNEEEI